MVLSEGSPAPRTETESKIQSFLVGRAAINFVLSLVDSLDLCRHLLYTFQDVSSYHNNEQSCVRESRSSIDRARNPSGGSLETDIAA